jgi:hypothetical protein
MIIKMMIYDYDDEGEVQMDPWRPHRLYWVHLSLILHM